ncbi:HAD family hydrolase [Pseudazoarcus pumilus]|uniref:phosphoglycolate phosphatase n=1 Tax=Pseudazoarcus pumilus TaxID=2067960 RepID=A0A2I6S5P1_9RHOO|nr:HAD-IA family hydrolase [Pseudazoarcus pumilus]AUN94582.1 phosphoglycolate phosphatase [Pseudazoarcus pumilus]
MADAILFDLDGTLADTAPDLAAAANRLRAEHDLPPLPPEALRTHTSSGARGMLRAAFDLHPEGDAYPDMVARFLVHYASALCVHTRLFDGMAELLDTLDANAIPWGIVTNKQARFTLPLVAALGLDTRACCVVSGDTTARPKPAPDPLLHACTQAHLDPARTLYVGDDLRDIDAGRAAGMPTVAAAWGYLGDEGPVTAWQADHVIGTPAELRPLVGL